MTDEITTLKDQIKGLISDFGGQISEISDQADQQKKQDTRCLFSKSIQAFCISLANFVPDSTMFWLPNKNEKEVQLFTSLKDYTQQVDQLNLLLQDNTNYVTEQLLRRNNNITQRLIHKVQSLMASSLEYQLKDIDLGIKKEIKTVDQQKDDPTASKNQDLLLNLTQVVSADKKPPRARKCDAININETRLTPEEGQIESSLEQVEWPTYEQLTAVQATKHSQLINLQIGGIQMRTDKKCYSRFNFLLTNSLRRDVDTEVWDLETVKIAQDSIIQQVQYCVQLKDGFLLGVRFLDAQGNILVEGGKFHKVDKRHFSVKNVELNDNERLVGFKARVDPKKPVYLFNVQWKIAKTVGQTAIITEE